MNDFQKEAYGNAQDAAVNHGFRTIEDVNGGFCFADKQDPEARSGYFSVGLDYVRVPGARCHYRPFNFDRWLARHKAGIRHEALQRRVDKERADLRGAIKKLFIESIRAAGVHSNGRRTLHVREFDLDTGSAERFTAQIAYRTLSSFPFVAKFWCRSAQEAVSMIQSLDKVV